MRIINIFLVAAALIASPSWAKPSSALSGMALQQIQAKDFETTSDVLFSAVVSVLQDSGFRVTEADKASGFVSGIGSSSQKMTYNIWFGVGKKKQSPLVSAFIEQRGPGMARVRLNFVMSTGKSRENMTDDKPITDPVVYREAFEKIEKEVFVRMAMNTIPPAATLVATPTAGTSTATITPNK